jgi:hypothetical protein
MRRKTASMFYVASALFDVMRSFSDDEQLDDEVNHHSQVLLLQLWQIEQQRKYALFKSRYILDCIKSGVTPVPGLPLPPPSESHS